MVLLNTVISEWVSVNDILLISVGALWLMLLLWCFALSIPNGRKCEVSEPSENKEVISYLSSSQTPKFYQQPCWRSMNPQVKNPCSRALPSPASSQQKGLKPDLLLKNPEPRSDTYHFLSDFPGGTGHMATHSCKGFWDM